MKVVQCTFVRRVSSAPLFHRNNNYNIICLTQHYISNNNKDNNNNRMANHNQTTTINNKNSLQHLPIIAPKSLTTIKGLREYRDTYLRPLLEIKQKELEHITEIHSKCEKLAERTIDYYASAFFIFLTGQALILFYWVYFLFDWNLVEPITYLLSYSAVWVGIACYRVTQREFSYNGLKEMITLNKMQKLRQKHNINIQYWQQLQVEVKILEERLRGLEDV